MRSRAGLARVGLVGLGLAGAGVVGLVGGVAAERAVVRRLRGAPDPAVDDDLGTGYAAATGAAVERLVVTGDGAHLRVLERGSGRPIVLLHGVTLAATIWRYQLAELAEAGYRVLAVDQRGHGRSDVGTGGLSLSRLADDLDEILEQLDLHDAVVVGHSMGGMVALRSLARRARSGVSTGASAGVSTGASARVAVGPGRVTALALVATSASPVHDGGIPGARAAVALVRPLAGATGWLASRLPGGTLPGNDLGFLATRLAFGHDPSPSQVALTASTVAAAPAKVSADLMLDILRFDDLDVIGAIGVPTSVVVGTNDLLTPLRHAEAMVDAIDGATLVVFERCGHMIMLERHERLSGVLVDLAERSTAAAVET